MAQIPYNNDTTREGQSSHRSSFFDGTDNYWKNVMQLHKLRLEDGL